MPGPAISLVILLMIGLAVYSWYSGKQRREMLATWAAGRGWTLRTAKVGGLHQEYPGLKFLTKGHSRRAWNIITGEVAGRPAKLMDYQYVTGSGKNRQTHNVGLVIVGCDHPVIPLSIRKENPFDKVGEFLGADDIDFESAEFSRTFYVKSHDRKWAYDVIHQRTMDYLLRATFYDLSFGFQEIAVHKRGHFHPDGYEEALKLAGDMLDLIPDYVVKQMKGEAR